MPSYNTKGHLMRRLLDYIPGLRRSRVTVSWTAPGFLHGTYSHQFSYGAVNHNTLRRAALRHVGLDVIANTASDADVAAMVQHIEIKGIWA